MEPNRPQKINYTGQVPLHFFNQADELLICLGISESVVQILVGVNTDPTTGKIRNAHYKKFRTFLVTAEPQPWRTFYKRLRLDPVTTDEEMQVTARDE